MKNKNHLVTQLDTRLVLELNINIVFYLQHVQHSAALEYLIISSYSTLSFSVNVLL